MLQHRGRTRLTQRDLAARVGVHLRSIQDWEAGHSHPSAQRLRALIAVFVGGGAFVDGLEMAEAQTLWRAAQAEAPRLKTPFDAAWFGTLLAASPSTSDDEPADAQTKARGPRRVYWGEAPDVAQFLGRVGELEVLRRWVLDEGCRIIAILGLGGVGKTLLATRLAQDVAPAFDYVCWRSLRNAPAPSEWLYSAIGFLAPDEPPPQDESAQLERLLELTQRAA
jgi:transcriptional regulator with XRE-family HTH domain